MTVKTGNRNGNPPLMLAVAGYDPISGAGITADVKTATALGVFCTTVITSLVIQNTVKVHQRIPLDPEQVRHQLDAVLNDVSVTAIKIGVVPSSDIAAEIAAAIERYHIINAVLDPVLAASDGTELSGDRPGDFQFGRLTGLCRLITPNIPEAEAICGFAISTDEDRKGAAEMLCSGADSPAAVLIKGGHNSGSADDLFYDGRDFSWFPGTRYNVECHGTGCVLSSAIAAGLAAGLEIKASIARAKSFVDSMLAANCFSPGHGSAMMDFSPNRLPKL